MPEFGTSSMIARMHVQPEQRKSAAPRQARSRRQAGPVQRTLQDGEIEEEEKQELDKVMEEMWAKVSSAGSVAFGPLVMNRKSFAQTVENVFALSFLVGWGGSGVYSCVYELVWVFDDHFNRLYGALPR